MSYADQIILNSFSTYQSYFAGLVSEAKFLDFYAYTVEDFEKESSNPLRKGWCFILEPYQADIRDNQADNVMGFCRGQFIIAKKKTSEAKWHTIEAEAEVRARKIVGRLRHDHRLLKVITHITNFKLQPIHPMAVAEYFGVVVDFDFMNPLNTAIKYLPEDWNTP